MHSIHIYSWDQVPPSLRALREQVFIREQKVPAELEWDEKDAQSEHFLLCDARGEALACARLCPLNSRGAAIGRMAVVSRHRHQGLGIALLRHIMGHAAERYDYLQLSAQEQVIGFYRRAGFFVVSSPYEDAGIRHVDMICSAPLQALFQIPETSSPMTLGRDTTTWSLTSDSDGTAMLRTLAWQCRRRLWLYDDQLDPGRYDDALLAQRLSVLGRGSHRADIRLLIRDDRSLMRRPHRLIQLMHRLPSRMQLRLVNRAYPSGEAPYVLADDQGLLYRHEFGSHNGFANFASPSRVRPLAEAFERQWQVARSSLELRQMPL
ncbi:MAG: GNAT family N-acetyltransferase [Oleiphilaceae bacterium]|nr:GNAT family N-acetyltransferase [Oleiphilaceae bacterium]